MYSSVSPKVTLTHPPIPVPVWCPPHVSQAWMLLPCSLPNAGDALLHGCAFPVGPNFKPAQSKGAGRELVNSFWGWAHASKNVCVMLENGLLKCVCQCVCGGGEGQCDETETGCAIFDGNRAQEEEIARARGSGATTSHPSLVRCMSKRMLSVQRHFALKHTLALHRREGADTSGRRAAGVTQRNPVQRIATRMDPGGGREQYTAHGLSIVGVSTRPPHTWGGDGEAQSVCPDTSSRPNL